MAKFEEELDQFIAANLRGKRGESADALRGLLTRAPKGLLPRYARLSNRIENDRLRAEVQKTLRIRLEDAHEIGRFEAELRKVFRKDLTPAQRSAAFLQLAAWYPGSLPRTLINKARWLSTRIEDDELRELVKRALLPHVTSTRGVAIRSYKRGLQAQGMFPRVRPEKARELPVTLPGYTPVERKLDDLLSGRGKGQRTRVFTRALEALEADYGVAGKQKSMAPRGDVVWVPIQSQQGPGPASYQTLPAAMPPQPAAAEKAEPQAGSAPHEPQSSARHDRIVNTGFASVVLPGQGLPRDVALLPATDYLFWLDVGAMDPSSIEKAPVGLPTELPEHAILRVALFGFEGELELDNEADVGELQIAKSGKVGVIRHPIADRDTRPPVDDLDTRLYFPVRTPANNGDFRLRCNIYCNQVLLQSRLVRVTVREDTDGDGVGESVQSALESIVDYTLTRSLTVATVAGLQPHRLSLLMNDSGADTHGLRFFGSDGTAVMKHDVALEGGVVGDWLAMARGALRTASWNDDKEWAADKSFRYDRATAPLASLPSHQRDALLTQLTLDLARLAIRGYRIYDSITKKLGAAAARFQEVVRTAGPVQVAIKIDKRLVLPVALFYDYHFDTNAFPLDRIPYELCPTFRSALLAAAPLEDCECFKGNCPVRKEGDAIRSDRKRTIQSLGPRICPSGFWGYRHSLGLPVTLDCLEASGAADAPTWVTATAQARVAAGISTDPNLRLFAGHEQNLRKRAIQLSKPSATRPDVLLMLQAPDAEVIYLYCHGGVSGKTPYLSVGPVSSPPITPDNINLLWGEETPLVFINGCHTTALDPEAALDFVSTFVSGHASGVIGTEITISESLACTFAEEFFGRFLSPTSPSTLGDAVRGARLALLQMGNPLGLVYIPFAVSSLLLRPHAGH